MMRAMSKAADALEHCPTKDVKSRKKIKCHLFLVNMKILPSSKLLLEVRAFAFRDSFEGFSS
jgi:hypothetical protein